MRFGLFLMVFLYLAGPYWHVFEKWYENEIKVAVKKRRFFKTASPGSLKREEGRCIRDIGSRGKP